MEKIPSETLVRYLNGQLSQHERDRLEKRLVEDDEACRQFDEVALEWMIPNEALGGLTRSSEAERLEPTDELEDFLRGEFEGLTDNAYWSLEWREGQQPPRPC